MSTPTWPQLVIPPQPIANPPIGAILDWPTATPPAMWLICDGTALATATYPDLFRLIGYSFGGSGANFALPDLRGRVTVAVGPGFAAGQVGGASTVALDATQIGAHNHYVNGTTVGDSPAHSHTGTTVGDDPLHAHTGTSAINNIDHAHHTNFDFVGGVAPSPPGTGGFDPLGGDRGTLGSNGNHTHTFTTATTTQHTHGFSTSTVSQHTHGIGFNSANAGGGAAHENMPPYAVLYKIIRVEAG
jgi:microcystin-dependent protein